MKKRIGLLFGGRSAEHEVSLVSARNVYEAIDKSKFDVVLIGIDPHGAWHLLNESFFLVPPSAQPFTQWREAVSLLPGAEAALVPPSSNPLTIGKLDAVFPVMHGTYAEDGTVQGLLKLLNIPFVGAGVLGSAVGMDKDVMKRLLRDAGLPVGKFLSFKKHNAPTWEHASATLGAPLFIKPANAGSSVGVHKVRNAEEWTKALADAFQFDTKVLAEEFIRCREIEVAVLGNDQPKASVPGEIIPTHEFYSYEAKYLDENGAKLRIPADLPAELITQFQTLAVQTFEALCCAGLARVDFFLSEKNEIYVNEINTIPGFTKVSMYPKLWEATGVPYAALIERLLELALEVHATETALVTNFEEGQKLGA
jgi:D-alanine-D-alanine ligase